MVIAATVANITLTFKSVNQTFVGSYNQWAPCIYLAAAVDVFHFLSRTAAAQQMKR